MATGGVTPAATAAHAAPAVVADRSDTNDFTKRSRGQGEREDMKWPCFPAAASMHECSSMMGPSICPLVKRFILVAQLGEGAFGKVFAAC